MKRDADSIMIDEDALDRIRRIGVKLLKVANCQVMLGASFEKTGAGERSMAAVEAQFFNSLPLSNAPEYIEDTKADRFLGSHKNVIGAPYVRFYASYPIMEPTKDNAVLGNNTVVGNLRVLDYSPRKLTDGERETMADLAGLVERELLLVSMDAARQELQKKNWNLRRESMIDPIVGTWNRVAITRMLKQEVVRCRKEEKPLSVLMIDLDGYKILNETQGSNVTDAMLVKIASRLRSCIRPHDSLGRYEAGKFLVLLPGASHEIARLVATRLQHSVRTGAEMGGDNKPEMTLSAGTVSTELFNTAESEELISLACESLTAAQKLGKSSIIQALPRNK